MLDKNYIKPIPKKIIALIKRNDKQRYKTPCGNTRFYSYLTTWKKELVKITVAVRHYRKQWVYKQVAIHGLRSENCLARDIELHYISGYVVGWYDMGLYNNPKCYEDGIWYSCERKYYNPYSITVNLDYLCGNSALTLLNGNAKSLPFPMIRNLKMATSPKFYPTERIISCVLAQKEKLNFKATEFPFKDGGTSLICLNCLICAVTFLLIFL